MFQTGAALKLSCGRPRLPAVLGMLAQTGKSDTVLRMFAFPVVLSLCYNLD